MANAIPYIISIHAPPRGATIHKQRSFAASADFNSRPSARGDQRIRHQSQAGYDFNSRPSARGDIDWQLRLLDGIISIHAPPRGATWRCWEKEPTREEFQFTPLREGRLRPAARLGIILDFNSRPSARGDAAVDAEKKALDISIHAPPRGATLRRILLPRLLSISIHAPPRGATVHVDEAGFATVFQFTPLREGRLLRVRHVGSAENFNSRPSARGDTLHGVTKYNSYISIHAPPRGATSGAAKNRQRIRYFNSRPSARGDESP